MYLCIEIPLSSLDLQPTRSVRSNTEETSGGRLVLRQKDALMVPNPRACSRGGSAPRDSSGSLASGETISPRIASVRSNTGETIYIYIIYIYIPVVDRYSAKKMP